jgi:protein-L-isoaspartate(D-aspartate) O-methyltransferase
MVVFTALFVVNELSPATQSASSPSRVNATVSGKPHVPAEGLDQVVPVQPAVESAESKTSETKAAPAPVAAPPAANNVPARAVQPEESPAVLHEVDSPLDITRRDLHPPLTAKKAYVSWMLSHTDQKESFLNAKWERDQSIRLLDQTKHDRVLEAFLLTPREYFCRDPRRAYENAALPIGFGQTISGPHMVARMTDYLDPQPEQKVLEIGTGSGYQSAVLSELSNHVYTIEIVGALARQTDAIYRRLETRYPEYKNINRKVDDGYYGWREYAPFDRIIVTCGIDHIPPELLKQLAPDGIMVIPIGPPSGQTILRIVKHVAPDGTVTLGREDIYHGKRKQIFVPFTAKEGGVHNGQAGTGEGQ